MGKADGSEGRASRGSTALAGAGYATYQRTLGRPPAVETVMVTFRRTDQPGVLLTGSGYVVTRHKYIIIGTKILGQIVEEPIEEGQHVKRGDLLARIDDRDYLAQLRQAIADRELAAVLVANHSRSHDFRSREDYTTYRALGPEYAPLLASRIDSF